MIRIEITDVRELSQKEATALGHMFMHLAGHTLHPAPDIPLCQSTDLMESATKATLPTPSESNPEYALHPPMVANIHNLELSSSSIPTPVEDLMGPVSEPVLDSTGIPWDSRIHARNKSQTPSGVWKLGRNIAPEYVKQVMAELRGNGVPMPPVAI